MKREHETMGGSPQGPFCLWQGLTVPGWIELLSKRPPLRITHFFRHLLCTGFSFYNSVFEGIENLFYGSKIAKTEIEQPPIFILGHWRSGTTLLHSLLARDQQFVYPNLYQVLFPRHFLVTEKASTRLTEWLLPKTRPMDNVPVTWDSPQEDETALCVLTQVSPYMMLAFNGQREKYGRFFDLLETTPSEMNYWKKHFLRLLKKLTLLSGRRLLLKSPTHSYRIPLLKSLFPNAKFLYIYRNPYAVFSSTVHLRKKLFEANTLGKVSFEGLEEDVLKTYEHLFERYENDRKLLGDSDLIEIRFEDLEKDPLQIMQQVYNKFSIPGYEAMTADLTSILPDLKRYQKNSYNNLEESTKRMIYDRWKPAFDRYQYESLLDCSVPQQPKVA